MQLYAELYLDEDVTVLLVPKLSARGFCLHTTQEMGRKGSADESQLTFAAAQGWSIVTHNRDDFALLHRQYLEAGRQPAGIIVLSHGPLALLADRLSEFSDQHPADAVAGQFWFA